MKVIIDSTTEHLLTGAHTLIAGTTGSGKTVVMNNIIYQLIQKPPTLAELVIIDPKRIGLSRFKGIPHIISYNTEPEQAERALLRAIDTMEARYQKLEYGRSIDSTIYIIIDELADLMITSKKNIMPLLQRLLQLGRESKIKLIVATQAPSRKIIPAELTLNIDTRLALRCISPIESRQIIGETGAEHLPQYGRGILRTYKGIERVFIEPVPPEKISELVNFWKD